MKLHTDDEEVDEKEVAETIGDMIAAGGGTWDPNTLSYYSPENRAICLAGEITPELATCIISQIIHLTQEDPEAEINIALNTPGGDAVAGLAIYDALRLTSCPIRICVQGQCASAGLFILQGADYRISYPSASFFHHEPISSGSSFTEEGIISHAQHYSTLKNKVTDIIKSRSKMNKSTWSKYFDNKTGFYFTAQEALEFKIIDHVLEYPKKKLKKG